MNWWWHIPVAVLLDFLIGDPRWLPHPVRVIGRVALLLESIIRRLPLHPRMSGIAVAIIIIVSTGGAVFALLKAASMLHPAAGVVVSILIIYTGIAARDLADHSSRVFRALAAGDIDKARREVAMIVGRDTANLDAQGVIRAAVESVGESIVDGITAPLFFACIGGPVGLMVYKAINTLDSTFGYKNERYFYFGWASARIDDAANFIPARLTALVMVGAAFICGYSPSKTWRIIVRDHAKHESPNAAYAEAAMAGALGIELGGTNWYQGVSLVKPSIGDPVKVLGVQHINHANRLMYATTILFTIISVLLLFIITHTVKVAGG
jgi:adenosylcobinamide-phosphate synthase